MRRTGGVLWLCLALEGCCAEQEQSQVAPQSSATPASPTEEERESAALTDVIVTDDKGKRWAAHAYELDDIMWRGWHISVDEAQTSHRGIPIYEYGRLVYLPAAQAEEELMSKRAVAWTNGKSLQRRRFEERERAGIPAASTR